MVKGRGVLAVSKAIQGRNGAPAPPQARSCGMAAGDFETNG